MTKPVFYTPSFSSDMAFTDGSAAFDLQSFDVMAQMRRIRAGNENTRDPLLAVADTDNLPTK